MAGCTFFVAASALVGSAAGQGLRDGTIFTVAGTGEERTRWHRLRDVATETELTAQAVAEMPDRSLLIAEDCPEECDVLRVARDGRLSVVAGGGRSANFVQGARATTVSLNPVDVAPIPDGSFLIVDGAGDRVLRVGTDGRITTVAGNLKVSRQLAPIRVSGDGGPATAAQLSGPAGVAALPGGGFLIADTDNQRVRRVGPDGTISTVAGSGPVAPKGHRDPARYRDPNTKRNYAGDGGPATAARLNYPTAVAVSPDGSFLIADSGNGRVRRVALDGRITTVAGSGKLGVADIAATADGGFLIASGIVRGVSPDGTITTVAGNEKDVAEFGSGLFGDNPFAGDGGPATAARAVMDGIAATADGGILIVGGDKPASDRVRFVVPQGGSRLAVAIGRGTRASIRNATIAYRTTIAAKVQLDVKQRGKRVARVSADATPGPNMLRIPVTLRRGERYNLRLVATSADGQRTTDRESIFPGGVLPVEAIRTPAADSDVLGRETDIPGAGNGFIYTRRCPTRFGPSRLDCEVWDRGSGSGKAGMCLEAVAYYVRGDGQLYRRRYDCPVRRNPWRSRYAESPTAILP